MGGACRPGPAPTPDGSVETTQEAGAETTPEPSPADEPAPPEPSPEPPPERRVQPEPKPVDEGPVVPEKVLINGIQGIIVHVTDGDTVYVVKKPGGWASVVRLKGLAAPECFKEKSQGSSFQECVKDDEVYGLESYKIMKKLALGDFRKIKIVCAEENGECEKGDFGRYLVYLELPDGRDLAQEVIKAGGGWSFTRFEAKKLGDYCRAEADAVKAKAGMWSQGRSAIRSGMSNDTRSWYYHRTTSKSHDGICSQKMGESFAKRAGE